MRRSLVALLPSLVFGLGCGKKIASLEFDGEIEGAVLNGYPVELPPLAAKDAAGARLELPPVVFAAEPPGIVIVDGNQIVTVGSGVAEVVARVPGTSVEARLTVRARMIEKVEILCEPFDCAIRVGEELTVRVEAVVGAERFPLSRGLEVGPKTVFAAGEGGRFRGIAPGVGHARFRGPVPTERELFVSPPADRVVLKCPVERTIEVAAGTNSCAVPSGKAFDVELVATGGGHPVHRPKATWSSSQPEVAEVAVGRVHGKSAGQAEIRAVVDGVTGVMPLIVQPRQPLDRCGGAYPLPIETFWTDGSTVRFHCANDAAVQCLFSKRGAADVSAVTEECCCVL